MYLLKKLITILSVIFFSSCALKKGKESIEFKKYTTAELKEDLKIFKGIITDMHAGAYIYNTPDQLNYIFDSISLSIKQPLTTREFYNKVDYIIDRLKCLHSKAYLPEIYYDSISKRPVFFPTPVIDIDDKLYVNSDVQNIPLGAEILSINDIKASDIINKLKGYRHIDGYSNALKKNTIDEDFAYHYFLAYGAAKDFTIDFIKDSSADVETKTFYGEKLNDIYADIYNATFFYYPTDVNYDLEIDDDTKTATLTIRTFSLFTFNETHAFNNFLHNSFRLIKQNGIKNLIIDCRNNSGGYYDATFSLLSYLVNKKLPEYDSSFQRFKHLTYVKYVASEDTGKIAEEDTAYLKYSKINRRLYKLNNDEITVWEPSSNVFNGRLVVIINGDVVSAASTFAAVLKDNTKALLIGEETRGSNDAHNASIISFVLPKTQIKIDIPLRRYYQPTIKKQNDRGVLPHKIIPLTVRDLIENRDRPMAYILDSILVK